MTVLIKLLIIFVSFISLISGINHPVNSSVFDSKNKEEVISDSVSSIEDVITDIIDSEINESIVSGIESNGEKTETSEVVPLVKMDLLIISGHANMEIDPGAVSNGRYEYAYAKEFTDLLANYIKEKYPHINVILEDAPYKASGEVTYINKVKPDYVISIHFNAGGGTGFEIITPLANKNLTVATTVISELKKENLPVRPLSIYSRSTTTNRIERTEGKALSGTDYYGVINMGSKLNIISEIFEMEFIDNNEAMKKYELNKSKYVRIIADAINGYYHEEFKN